MPGNAFIHGKSNKPEYTSYYHIRRRCLNHTDKSWKDYGGRGIICEWQSFVEFYRDMGERPGPEYSIERIDNNGPYNRKNCRWATRLEQNNNSRKNHFLTYQGKTQTIAQWARETGLRHQTIHKRIARGWSPKEIFMGLPHRKTAPVFTFQGRTHTFGQWADIVSIAESTLRNRFNRGWSIPAMLTKTVQIQNHNK